LAERLQDLSREAHQEQKRQQSELLKQQEDIMDDALDSAGQMSDALGKISAPLNSTEEDVLAEQYAKLLGSSDVSVNADVPLDTVQQEELAEPAAEAECNVKDALEGMIPPGVRVCILGGQKFNDEFSQPLVEALAQECSAQLASRVVVLTGGMPGVQLTFANGCSNGPPVVNMLPKGQASNFDVGVDFAEFADLKERIEVFGQIGDIYISVEGGPGVSKEANAAFERGAIVLPMISTGGASGGLFDFPAAALQQPSFASAEDWDLLSSKGDPEATARAVVAMILNILPVEEVGIQA